ncbi:MAG TPA: TlyA family RNA methyltransferase [Nitrospirales bacterium]|nr:TlyA family rRNA (cytidine-2'-O)-methyltransferase [Nitrospiraceae bacterium]HNP28207.1 TlyA family RNA methyltransferase [Nitrospirales bacterium]
MKAVQPSVPSRKPSKERLDSLVLTHALVSSREQASRLILAGRVKVDGILIDKPGKLVATTVSLEVTKPEWAYASRAGEKLAPALDAFLVSCSGCVVMDVGASTGGFTDCVLQRGASRVYAIDVGYGQLDWRLRSDPRVVVMDRFNIRNLCPHDIPEPVDLAVIDVSFISLRLVLPVILPVMSEQAYLVALVKPQFEVGKGQVGKGGIVRDERLRDQVRDRFVDYARSLQLEVIGVMDSTVLGKKGNKEMLVGMKKNGKQCTEGSKPIAPGSPLT